MIRWLHAADCLMQSVVVRPSVRPSVGRSLKRFARMKFSAAVTGLTDCEDGSVIWRPGRAGPGRCRLPRGPKTMTPRRRPSDAFSVDVLRHKWQAAMLRHGTFWFCRLRRYRSVLPGQSHAYVVELSPVFTSRVDGPSWRVTGFQYPSTRAVL